MEAHAALVGADSAVHLDAEPAIDLDLALVVDPGDAEHDDALGLGDALEDLLLAIDGVLVEHHIKGLGDLLRGLVELDLRRVLGPEFGHEFVNESAHVAPSTRRAGLGFAYDSVACHARLRRWREAPAVYALVYHPAVAMRAKPARRPRGRQAFAASTRSTTAAVCSMSPSSRSRCVTKRTVHGPSSRQSTPASPTTSGAHARSPHAWPRCPVSRSTW